MTLKHVETISCNASVNIHIPTLCIAQAVCNLCCDNKYLNLNPNLVTRINCGICKIIFYGKNCVKEIVDYIFELTKLKKL